MRPTARVASRAPTSVSACGRITFCEPANPTHHATKYFSRAVVANGIVHVSGTGPGHDAVTGAPRRGTAADEAAWAMENVRHILRECGSDLAFVFRVTMLLTDRADYNECNEAYLKFFDAAQPPMRTCALWGVPADAKVAFACEALLAPGDAAPSKL